MNRVKEPGQRTATERPFSEARQPESPQGGRPPASEAWLHRRFTALSLDGWAVTAAFLAALLVLTGVIKRIPW